VKRLAPLMVAGVVGLSACADYPTTALLPENAALNTTASDGAVADRYVILMKSNSVPADLAARIQAAGGQLVHTLPQVGIVIAAASNPGFADAIGADSRVMSVGLEPAMALPEVVEFELDPTQFPAGPAVTADAPLSPTAADNLYGAGLVWGVQRVNAPAAWTQGAAYTGSGAVVGVLDTGIASNHPDLGPSIVFNGCFSSRGDVVGRTWQAGDPCNPYPNASDHGTHVAGTVAARFGGGRVVGVAPNASLANYNVFEVIPGLGVRSFTSSRWRAMIHAADNGVDVINMSLGSFTFIGNKLREEPVRQNRLATFLAAEKRVANYVTGRGTVLVSSAGNSGADLNGIYVASPGQIQGHITVGSTGIRPQPRFQPGISTDVRSFFSNYGADIDVAAPGGDCGLDAGCGASRPANWFEYLVLSSTVRPAAACAQTQSCVIGYGWKGGTSMAAPHVTGVAAIVRAVNPRSSALQVNSTITSTAEWLGDRQQFGHGIPDAAAAAGVR
jgi:subtilisin family serine protease